MKAVFLQILDMSVSASILAAVVILLRLLLKKAPKYIHCILWAMVALRLVCPSLPESQVSVMPDSHPVSSVVQPQMQAPVTDVQHPVQTPQVSVPDNTVTLMPEPEKTVDWMNILSVIWLSGVGAMALYGFGSYILLRRKVSPAIKEDGIWLCDNVVSPFILGIFRPRIYMPSGLDMEHRSSVLAHEKAHLRRKDHWWKPMGFVLLVIHWFNPVMWIAYVLLCRDIEAACDERVVKGMEPGERKRYSEALLSCAAPRRSIAACPLAFGEQGIKGRIKSVLNYKKPTVWIILASVVASVAVGVLFLTNPLGDQEIEYAIPANSNKMYADSSYQLKQYFPDFFEIEERVDVEVFVWEEDNEIWCGMIPIGDKPITQNELDNVRAIQLSNAGPFINYSSLAVRNVHILGEFPSLNMSDGRVWTDDIVELYLMERLYWLGGFYMMGKNNLRYDGYINTQSRSYSSTGEVLDTGKLGLLLAEQIETPSCIFGPGIHRPQYDVYSVVGKDSTYLAVYSVDDQEYILFKEYDPSQIEYTEPEPVERQMEGHILNSIPSQPAIEEDCFYFNWKSWNYRVYYPAVEGLYEGQPVRVTYMSDTQKRLEDPEQWSITYEVTAVKVEPLIDIGEVDTLIYFRIYDKPTAFPNTDKSYYYFAAPVTAEERNILCGFTKGRAWMDPALLGECVKVYGITNVVTDDGWNMIALCENGILTNQGYSAFSPEEYELMEKLKSRLSYSNEAREYFTDDYLVYQQKTKQSS